VYASADAFLFASQTDTFGQVVLEAQASGLPVVAVGEGGPASLIVDGETGVLCPPDAEALATAVISVATQPLLASRLRRAALAAVRGRTWEAALRRLADGYHRVLAEHESSQARRVA
jgi:glycosyltransferase involved in cell wall biosynthesis